jgi:hypothetical protein
MADLRQLVLDRLGQGRSGRVWTPVDFLDLGNRAAVDKTLQRLAGSGDLRRIDRGLYDVPRTNALTKKPAVPDYRQIIDALARRDQVRMLVDGLTAANDLGLTTAVPSHVVVHTDARRRSIQLDKLKIDFKHTAPSKLYWAGRPAMRVVQALHWLKDTLPSDRDRIVARLSSILKDPKHGKAICDDLREGSSTLPAWMQTVVRDLVCVGEGRPRSRRQPKVGQRREGPKNRRGASAVNDESSAMIGEN